MTATRTASGRLSVARAGALILALCAARAHAVPFVSDGSDGAFAPTGNTSINLSTEGAGGVFNFTTIDIPAGVTVHFVLNPSNPAVVFGATGDVNIAGTIVVSAGGQTGGPGGGEGGAGGNGPTPAADGTGLAPGHAGGFISGERGGGGGGGGNATPGGVATARTGPAPGAAGGAVAPPADITGGSGGGGGAGGLFFGSVNTSGGRGGGAGGGLQISTPGTIDLTGSLLSDGAHGGYGYAILGGPGGGGSGGNFELDAAAIHLGATSTIRAIGGAGGGLSSESCTITDPYRCSSFANGGLGYAVFNAAGVTLDPGADIFAQPAGASIPGFSPTDPLLPGSTGGGTWSFGPVSVLPTAFGGFGGPSLWFDPEVAVGYDYAVTGGRIATVELPSGFGDDLYEIWLENPLTSSFELVQTLAAGVRLDLTALDPFGTGALGGVDALRVLGIELAEGLDPTDPAAFPTGLTFVPLSGGFGALLTPELSMTALTETTGPGTPPAAAPEPGTLALAGIAGAALWYARRRREWTLRLAAGGDRGVQAGRG